MAREDLDRQLTVMRTSIIDLARFVDELFERAMSSVATGDAYDARIARSREDDFDRTCEALEEQPITLLTLQQPILAADLRLVLAVVLVAQRLQRVGHGALGVAELAIDLAELGAYQSPPPEMLALSQEARGMLRDAVQALSTDNKVAAARVVAQDSQVDAHYQALRDDLLRQMETLQATSPQETPHRRLTFWLWIAHKLERVADHAVVIARRTEQI
jgi:phosphate transport system protein